MTNTEYDYIVLGGGHNGLIAQAYLGKAGMRTLCVERRSDCGGGLETIEDPRYPGFRHNTHSFFHRGITRMPWYRELELERLGAAYIEPELCTAVVRRDGETLQWWTGIERTVESFARFSRRDAAALRRWTDAFVPIVEEILEPESRSAPESASERTERLKRSAGGRLLLEVSALSPLEFVLKEFEHPFIQAGLLFFNGLREVDLRCPGFGHHIPALFASSGRPQMARGGSKSLATALRSAVAQTGGEFRFNAEPEEILVEKGRAIGVKLRDGGVIKARRGVVSSLNPQQTFLDLVPDGALPQKWREKARDFRYNLIAPLFGLNLNLREPPCYAAAERYPEIKDALMIVLGLETVDQFSEIVCHHESGTIPPTVMWGSCPSYFDPSQAPDRSHTAFMWEKLPYRINGDAENWDRAREGHGRVMLDLWREFAPNLNDTVIDAFTRSPLDTYRTLPNMEGGDLLVGSFEHGQIGIDRPFEGAGQYRTAIEGLFLCGSCCHPGGNVTGLPGYNASKVVLQEAGVSA